MLLASFIISPLSALLKLSAQATAKPVVQVARGVKRVVTVWRHKREVARLTELSAHELKDIGLTRSDVIGALAGHWLVDPSAVLSARSVCVHGVAAARRAENPRQLASPAAPAAGESLCETCVPRGA